MNTPIRRFSSMVLGVYVTLAAASAYADPSQVLEDKGLKKLTSNWVLPDEQDFNKALSEMRKYKKELTNAIKDKAKVEKGMAAVNQEMDTLRAQRAQIRQLSANETSATRYNRLIQQSNTIGMRMQELYEIISESKELKEANQKLAQSRQEYVEELGTLRRRATQIEDKYKELAQDKDVTAALEEIKAAGEKPTELGPSRAFESNLRNLEQYEKAVDTESIPMRAESNTFHVYVSINGAPGKEFVFDTGASSIVMSSMMAKDLGISVPDDAQVINCQIADGSICTGKLVFLESAKVGKFEVANVEAVVMDPQYPNAPPLLGGAFINNFFYHIDPATASLTLSRLAEEEDAKKSTKRSRR